MSVDGWIVLSQHIVGTIKGYRQVQQEVHVKQVSVHDSLLIGKPELPPSGDGGNLDNCRSETIIIWLGCEVGAS